MTTSIAPLDTLDDDTLFVRPPAERIPVDLVGTAAGDVFGELVRWHDGPEHRHRRATVERFVAALDTERLGRDAAVLAAAAGDEARFDVPLAVVAAAVGVAADHVDRAVALARAAARGMGPGASGPASEAIAAVPELLAMLPGDDRLDAPNRLGLLLQTCHAVAALIAAAMARAAGEPEDAGDPRRLVERTLVDDPPVRVARRFRHDGTPVAVDLTGHPFGAGRHRCPGPALAVALAAGTIAGLSRRAAAGGDER